ncbi:hypothetical protein P4T89_01970 [Bacillus nakamurai]|uniref:Uncharacterized protein n=1 Tax=Bacillus nakamurai TaxID=1793963 RepID=A0A150FBI7_9BACI|nr:hypothetical protein [Bacillus nakamurai]KXZ22581.1 hypothetical protein AXI58_07310 [Bacillus nakamurai]MED1226412.1 hypothetical protein [Bacillus nakamurai]
MIDKLFTINNFNAVTLKNCTLYLNIEHIPIGTVYIMPSSNLQEYTKVGIIGWKYYKRLPSLNKGYFSTEEYSNYVNSNLNNYKSEEIHIIGYDENIRYHLLDISIGKRKNVNGPKSFFGSSFQFNDYQTKLIKRR